MHATYRRFLAPPASRRMPTICFQILTDRGRLPPPDLPEKNSSFFIICRFGGLSRASLHFKYLPALPPNCPECQVIARLRNQLSISGNPPPSLYGQRYSPTSMRIDYPLSADTLFESTYDRSTYKESAGVSEEENLASTCREKGGPCGPPFVLPLKHDQNQNGPSAGQLALYVVTL